MARYDIKAWDFYNKTMQLFHKMKLSLTIFFICIIDLKTKKG